MSSIAAIELFKNLESIGQSDVGAVRSVNQDSFSVDDASRTYIVADGMGGHAGGEIASKLAIMCISEFLEANKEIFDTHPIAHPDGKIVDVLTQAVNHASTTIYERALEEPSLKGMGTTATVLKFVDSYAYCAHVGDSRLYLLRSGFIYQLTMDHSLVSEQLRAGLISAKEAEEHHLKNVITRSVGFQEKEDVDVYCHKVENDDIYLLCSDGLSGKVSDIEISALASKLGKGSVQKLIEVANANGGEDNITAVLVKI